LEENNNPVNVHTVGIHTNILF